MQKLQKGAEGIVGALRADAGREIARAGERSMQRASEQALALAARRVLSEGWLCRKLDSCRRGTGSGAASARQLLEGKASGTNAEDAAGLLLCHAVSMLLGDAVLRITLRGYVSENGYRSNAADLLADHVLRNPNYWPVGGDARPPAQPKAAEAQPDGIRGWALAVGHC